MSAIYGWRACTACELSLAQGLSRGIKTSIEAVSEISDPEAKDERLSRLSSVPRQLYRWNTEVSYSPVGLTQAV